MGKLDGAHTHHSHGDDLIVVLAVAAVIVIGASALIAAVVQEIAHVLAVILEIAAAVVAGGIGVALLAGAGWVTIRAARRADRLARGRQLAADAARREALGLTLETPAITGTVISGAAWRSRAKAGAAR